MSWMKWSLCLALFLGAVPAATVTVYAQDKEEAKQEELSKEEQVQAAIQMLQSEPEKAVEAFRKIYEADKSDWRVAATFGQVLQNVGMTASQDERKKGSPYYYEAAKIGRELLKNKEFPAQGKQVVGLFIYNEACSLAVDGEKEKALKALGEAMELGFNDFAQIEKDEDLASLRDGADFKKFLEEQKALAAKRMVDEAKEEVKAYTSFDFDFDTKDLSGEEVSLKGLKGKVVIVDFWGTWCPPCRAEIPSFVKLKEKYGDKIEIVGLAYERGEPEKAAEQVKKFMQDNKINYPCALGTEETMAMVPDFQGYPTTLFIDRDGKVRMLTVGLEPYEKLEALTQVLLDSK